MEKRIPFIVFGDGPRNPTGLGRIARDLSARLVAEQEALGIRFAQVGVDDPGGWHWQSWDFYGYQPNPKDQGRGSLSLACAALEAEAQERPIVLSIFDPARIYDLTRPMMGGEVVESIDTWADLWGYFPIDAVNPGNEIGGPAAEAVSTVDRAHAYGRWGAQVLRRTRETVNARRPEHRQRPQAELKVSYLPHGIETRAFCPRSILEADPLFSDWMAQHRPGTLVIGCVATNQARKDLSLLFSSAAYLRTQYGLPVAVWLHTDDLHKGAWDIGELAFQFGFSRQTVLATTVELTDTQLAARYTASSVTLAPGLGEGFGYPIVESLSCGTLVVHPKYAGAVDLVTDARLLVEPHAWRLESIYVLQRPVMDPRTVGDALLEAASERQSNEEYGAWARGSVAHLDWEYLWPRWRAWIAKGLTDVRRQRRIDRAGGPGSPTAAAAAPEQGAGHVGDQPPG